ncbi:MAG: alpha/beta fold hydrolase [bacterium]|nr:alpha/beta fold hydrolase [bacterium]
MKKIFIYFLFVFTTCNLFSQELKRLSLKGFARTNLTSQMADTLGLKNTEGVYVQKIIPGTIAEILKLQVGDVLIKINSTVIKDKSDILKPELKIREGEMVTYTVIRKKKELILKCKANAAPYETSTKLKVFYSSFKFQTGLIRSIFLIPKTSGKKPAILFIPGYPCESIDNLFDDHPYKKLVYGLAEKGYVVMRAEKPGVGDSYNTPDCYSINFKTEVESFNEALKALKKNPEVDTNNIFVLGHSMGGMEAPYVAAGSNVKGIIVMGITMKPWLEYLTEMIRVQNPNLGIDYITTEKDLKLYESLLYELLVKKKKPSEMIAQNPEYSRLLKRDFNYSGGDDFLTRDIVFSQTLNEINITSAWANTTAKVLSAWGETDIQTLSDFSHRELVKIVNTYHPNNATFLQLKATDHNLMLIPTIEESYKRNAMGTIRSIFAKSFNYQIIEEFDKWMQNVISNK